MKTSIATAAPANPAMTAGAVPLIAIIEGIPGSRLSAVLPKDGPPQRSFHTMRFERAYALARSIASPDGKLNFLRVLNDYQLTIAVDV
jgi:hypothetical protein